MNTNTRQAILFKLASQAHLDKENSLNNFKKRYIAIVTWEAAAESSGKLSNFSFLSCLSTSLQNFLKVVTLFYSQVLVETRGQEHTLGCPFLFLYQVGLLKILMMCCLPFNEKEEESSS